MDALRENPNAAGVGPGFFDAHFRNTSIKFQISHPDGAGIRNDNQGLRGRFLVVKRRV